LGLDTKFFHSRRRTATFVLGVGRGVSKAGPYGKGYPRGKKTAAGDNL
jgi:hypothetical protein